MCVCVEGCILTTSQPLGCYNYFSHFVAYTMYNNGFTVSSRNIFAPICRAYIYHDNTVCSLNLS